MPLFTNFLPGKNGTGVACKKERDFGDFPRLIQLGNALRRTDQPFDGRGDELFELALRHDPTGRDDIERTAVVIDDRRVVNDRAFIINRRVVNHGFIIDDC